ncbi:MAG: Rrf2 family transcriptional regulator [Firmicutes bacterium HGW-Firmicutes-16]|nr:MAG: Rrf2 family transcriptional regulator [Firmicutes bacterium HGW-Firmicutes-16]
MRISTKGRYALAAAVCMAQQYGSGEYITAVSISDKLGISKIYLEQVFSLLKRGGLVVSVKGAQGGYLLSRSPNKITAYEVLSSVESSLFEKTEDTVAEKAPEIDKAMRQSVFDVLDGFVIDALAKVTLEELTNEAEMNSSAGSDMFYI